MRPLFCCVGDGVIECTSIPGCRGKGHLLENGAYPKLTQTGDDNVLGSGNW